MPEADKPDYLKNCIEDALAKGAKVIIAGSGMSHGGRIRRHEQNYLSDPRTTVLLVGYQAPGTLGRLMLQGTKAIRIQGEEVAVNARIRSLDDYSGHADRDQFRHALFLDRTNKSFGECVQIGTARRQSNHFDTLSCAEGSELS